MLSRLLEGGSAALLAGLIVMVLALGGADADEYGSWSGGLAIVAFTFWLRSSIGLFAARYFHDQTSALGWTAIVLSAVVVVLVAYAYAAGGQFDYDFSTGEWVWRLYSDTRSGR